MGAILIGGLFGLLLKQGIPEKVKTVVIQAIGLSTIAIGIISAIETQEILLLVLSLVIGGVIGTLLMIDSNLEKLGKSIESKFSSESGGFAKGFVLATLLYCVGSMTIVGSINAGINQDYDILFVKSILDGITSLIFTATLGYGVIFSIFPVLVIQGGIVLLAQSLKEYLTEEMTTELSAVGGVLILAIGLNLLEIKKIPLGDFLPSLFIPIVYFLIF